MVLSFFFFFPDHFHIRIISVSVSNMFRELFLDPICLTTKCMSVLVIFFFFCISVPFEGIYYKASSLTHTLSHCIINLCILCIYVSVCIFILYFVYITFVGGGGGGGVSYPTPLCSFFFFFFFSLCLWAGRGGGGAGVRLHNQPSSFTSVCHLWHFPWCHVATPREQVWSCLQLDFKRNILHPSLHHSRPYVLFLQCSLHCWGCCLWRSLLFFSTYKWNLVVPGIVLLD